MKGKKGQISLPQEKLVKFLIVLLVIIAVLVLVGSMSGNIDSTLSFITG